MTPTRIYLLKCKIYFCTLQHPKNLNSILQPAYRANPLPPASALSNQDFAIKSAHIYNPFIFAQQHRRTTERGSALPAATQNLTIRKFGRPAVQILTFLQLFAHPEFGTLPAITPPLHYQAAGPKHASAEEPRQTHLGEAQLGGIISRHNTAGAAGEALRKITLNIYPRPRPARLLPAAWRR